MSQLPQKVDFISDHLALVAEGKVYDQVVVGEESDHDLADQAGESYRMYMEEGTNLNGLAYQQNRTTREVFWTMHYGVIQEIISAELKALNCRKKNMNISFMGITPEDIEDGCLNLCDNPVIRDFVFKSKRLVFSGLEEAELDESAAKLLELGSHDNFFLQREDLTDGLGGAIEVMVDDAIENGKSFQQICTLLKIFLRQVRAFYQLSSKPAKPQAPPEPLDTGFSLMLHTATTLPTEMKMLDNLDRSIESGRIKPGKKACMEKLFFDQVQIFNDFLLEYNLAQWFERNPGSDLVIFTDIEKIFYGEGMRPGEERIYSKLSPEFASELEALGYEVKVLERWEWKDEEDHYHLVYGIRVREGVSDS